MAALGLVLAAYRLVPAGIAFVVYVLAAEFLATYLIHCPAHYVVGRLGGIRFSRIRFGKTALVKLLPSRISWLGRLLPTPTLSVDRPSLMAASGPAVQAMYFSGTVASSASAVVIAIAVSYSGSFPAAVAAWVLAVGYILFDAVFSPRGGDVKRARVASGLRRPSPEPVDSEE